MEIGRIKNATRVLGKSQGYYGLPIREIRINCTVNGPNTPAMETAWLPSVEEMRAMVAGAPIILRILGSAHPPVMLRVGDEPDSASEA